MVGAAQCHTSLAVGTAERSHNIADTVIPMKHQHDSESASMIFAGYVLTAFCIRLHSLLGIVAMIDIA